MWGLKEGCQSYFGEKYDSSGSPESVMADSLHHYLIC